MSTTHTISKVIMLNAALVVLLVGCTPKKPAAPVNTNTNIPAAQTQAQPASPQVAGIAYDKFSINLKFKSGTDVCGTQKLLPDTVMQWVLRINTVCAQAIRDRLQQRTGGNAFDPSLWVTVQIKADATPDTVLSQLKQVPGIETAEFNPVPQL